MRATIVLTIATLLLPATSRAGHIYGSLRERDQPLAQLDVKVVNGTTTSAGKTENNGSYRVFMPAKGKCTFGVLHKGKWREVEIHSYDRPTRYDFELVPLPDANYRLVRR